MIKISNLTISFDKKRVLENINLEFPRIGLFCVCGESGSGKSSLLNAISSLIDFEGSITIDGVEINKLSDEEKANYRLRNIGFIFQDFKLFNNQNIEQNVCFPLNVLCNCSENKKKQKCNDLLDVVGLKNFNKRLCNSLSGGEKQRVSIARALINNPKIIVADEPTGSLDEKTGLEIMALLKKFSMSSLVIMVTHDIELANKFADKIIFIKDRTIENIQNNSNTYSDDALALSNKEKQKNKSSVPLFFAINHAKQSLKVKRVRSILSTLFMSLGLMGIGLSISFSDSISKDMKRSYNSLAETSSISITKNAEKNEILKPTRYEDTKNLVEEYQNEMDISCGVGYSANFEELFKDCNEFYLESKNYNCFINEISIRNVNDFLAITKINESIFPENIKELNDDEIVLGLTIAEIRNICATFHIERSVTSLSKYLVENEIKAIFDLANFDWEYTDQQMFTVKGFTLSLEPYIAHSNMLFNKVVLEDNMRLKTTDDFKVNEFPWVLEKITYIQTDNKYNFVKRMREDGVLNKYIFEVCDKKVFINRFFNLSPNEIDCLVVYYCPKFRLSEDEINYILSIDQNLKRPIVYNRQGYVNYPENLVSGFANRTYFSLTIEDLYETTENNSSIMFKNNETEVLKEGVIYSDFSQSFINPVKFDSNMEQLKSGRVPENLDEIVVSTGMLKSLNSQNNSEEILNIATAVKEINPDFGIYSREYQIHSLKIVGIIENEKNVIYHNQNWTEDFFILKNGQKVQNLMPCSISFSLDDKVNSDELVKKLKRAFPQYDIINPLLNINNSIDSLCNSISLFVLCISGIALVISFILLSSCSYLHIQDIKNEIALARCIGINSKESMKFLYGFIFYSSLFSLIVASLELTLVNLGISYFSSSILALPFEFSMTVFAYIAMSLGCLAIGFVTSIISAKHIRKISPIDCLKI